MTVHLALVQALLIVGIPLGLWLLPAVRRAFPLVVLQIMVGFVLGPALAGAYSARYPANTFLTESSGLLEGLAFYGVLLFVFITGAHLEAFPIGTRRAGGTTRECHEFWTVALSSLLVPMTFGVVAAALLWQRWPELQGPQATRLAFLLVLGLATAITALPVLSAILIESNNIDSPVGRFVLTTATVHDAALWILLAFLLVYVDAGNRSIQPALGLLFQTGLFALFLLLVVRRVLAGLVGTAWWAAMPTHARFSLVLVGLLVSAYVTESIGVHYLIGAVLYGAILPGSVKRLLIERVEPFVVVWLMPFYFVTTGMQGQLDLGAPAVWAVFAAMTTVKLGGQLIGTTLPLRILFGRPWRFALQGGIYMTCAGIVQIVVLGLAHERGLISNSAYSGMVLSALATTAMTRPLVAAVQSVVTATNVPDWVTERPESAEAGVPLSADTLHG